MVGKQITLAVTALHRMTIVRALHVNTMRILLSLQKLITIKAALLTVFSHHSSQVCVHMTVGLFKI